MKVSNRRAKLVAAWGLLVLGAASAFACSSPNWQNQYTEEPVNYGSPVDDAGADAEDAADGACTSPTSPNCNNTLSGSPPASSTTPIVSDPSGNPDPVPWAVDTVLQTPKAQ